MTRPRFTAISSFFLSRGYVVVLPLRRGYGVTGGRWAEDYGRCDTSRLCATPAWQTAADIRAAIDYMTTQPFVAPDRTIVVGQSAGGWGTLALSSLNPPGVPGMIALCRRPWRPPASTRRRTGNCVRPHALVQAAAKFWLHCARAARSGSIRPTTASSSPASPDRMVAAYTGAGGQATFRPVGSFGNDGHNLASSDNGRPIWQPLLTAFLARIRETMA